MQGVKIEGLNVRADERGVVFEPLTADMLRSGKLRNVHVATMRRGSIRGNHRHRKQTEIICILGPMLLVLQDAGGVEERVDFKDGEIARVTIAPNIAHAFVNTGDRETFIVCASDVEAGGDATERVPLVS